MLPLNPHAQPNSSVTAEAKEPVVALPRLSWEPPSLTTLPSLTQLTLQTGGGIGGGGGTGGGGSTVF